MTKRSENKDRVLQWLNEHKEALETDSLKPLKDAFPDERKQNLSAWKKEYIQKGLKVLKQIKQDTDMFKHVIKDKQSVKQSTIKEKEPVKTGSSILKQVKTDLNHIQKQSIIFADVEPEPKEIKENCYYTVDQTADLLQVDSSIIYRLIKNKTLPVLNIANTGARPTFRILGKWLLELKSE